MNDEATELVKDFHKQLIAQMTIYEQTQKQQMTKLLNNFDNAVLSGNNCDTAIFAILDFAGATGIALQHTDFNDFSKAMMSDENFVLGAK